MKKLMVIGALFLLIHIPYQKYQRLISLAASLVFEKESLPQLKIISKGIDSIDKDEFSPDGNTSGFCRKSVSTLRSAVIGICSFEFKNGKWQPPQVVSFFGKYKDFNSSIPPDQTHVDWHCSASNRGKPLSDKPNH
jgi:hypothetical protein